MKRTTAATTEERSHEILNCTCDCSGVATSLIPISLNWKGALMSKLSVFVALSAAIAASTAGADDKIRATLMGFQEVPAVSTQGETATFEGRH